ncbi:MAG: lyase family protein [Candidatus Heimdallarchaeota archaeon]
MIPTAMHLACISQITKQLLPVITLMEQTHKKITEFKEVIKVGRTHLQDAVPISLEMEFAVYKEQLMKTKQRLESVLQELYLLLLGGTIFGTGLNASSQYTDYALANLRELTGFPFKTNSVKAEGIASHNSLAYLSSVLKLLALTLLKMTNNI